MNENRSSKCRPAGCCGHAFPIFTRHTFDSEFRTNIYAKFLIAIFTACVIIALSERSFFVYYQVLITHKSDVVKSLKDKKNFISRKIKKKIKHDLSLT